MQSWLLFFFVGASPAAYRVYRRATTYAPAELVAEVEPDTLSYTLTGQASSSSLLYYVNAVSACGVESTISAVSRLRRVAFDGDANLIQPAPNAPHALKLTTGEGGLVTAAWNFNNNNAEAETAGFNVYVATGEDSFDYGTPDFVIDNTFTRSQALGTYANGTTVRCVIRAFAATGVEETNTTAATTTAVADAPTPPTQIAIG